MRIIALIVPALLAMVQYLVYGSRLPERMATHFGADGQANGWMSRGDFFAFYAVMMAVLLLVLVVAAPASIGRLPPSMINLPNRDYWLAPEHLEETRGRLRRMMAIFGLGTGLFVVYVMQLVLQFNQDAQPGIPMPSMVGGLVAFLLFVVGFVVVMVLGFRRPQRA